MKQIPFWNQSSAWRILHRLAILFFIVWLCAAIQASPNDLDPNFGNGGIVISPFTEYSDNPTSIQVQPDGKIIVSGYSYGYDPWSGYPYPMSGFIARYNSSGTLDASFGSNGKVLIGNSNEYVGFKTALQPDGKIVTVGQKFTLNGIADFAVFRYNANGTLDTSFGTGGKVFTAVEEREWEPYSYQDPRDVVLQPDGKIVVMGILFVTGGNGIKFGIVRYFPDGSLDNNFGLGGKVITEIASASGPDSDVSSMLLQPDGKIVLVGSYNYDILLVRYNADGTLDSGFGANGRVTSSTPSQEIGLDSVLQPDGKIVVAGYAGDGSEILRFNSNGSVDMGFAANGMFKTDSGFFVGNSIALQPDGKLVAFGGATVEGSGNNTRFAVARLNANGTLDASFGTNGRIITAIGTGVSWGLAVALQPNGKIIGSGVTDFSDGSGDAAIVRYLGDVGSPNQIDDPQFFVRQHYLDFLNREPDPPGDAGWRAILINCLVGDSACDRIHVSSAFFRSLEFQGRGYFVYRFYPVAFGRKPDYDEFTPDLAKVSGFLTDAELEAAKTNFIAEFMNRPAFLSKFIKFSNADYVDALLSSADITHPSRDSWIAALTNGSRTRAQVLREIAESTEVYDKYYNQAFVVMQYFGYLRRQPDGLYLNWIAHLDATGDYRSMIHGFMNSIEYRARFGP